jgi:hypothetical protein
MEEKSYLGIIQKKLKTGREELTFNKTNIGKTLLDFWKWSVSDIISNSTRGKFAEFIIANAMGIDITEVRDEWSAFDLISPEGIKIEVKSSAYMQSWNQKKESIISFSIKRSLRWDPETNRQEKQKKIQADVYAFCLLKPRNKIGLNPLDLNQWGFYILTAKEIENYKRSQHSITLTSLKKLTEEITYNQIRDVIIRKYKNKV